MRIYRALFEGFLRDVGLGFSVRGGPSLGSTEVWNGTWV